MNFPDHHTPSHESEPPIKDLFLEVMHEGTEELRLAALERIMKALRFAEDKTQAAKKGTEIMLAYDYWKEYTEAQGEEPADILPSTLDAVHAMSNVEKAYGANLMANATTRAALDRVVSRVGDYWLVKITGVALMDEAVTAKQSEFTK